MLKYVYGLLSDPFFIKLFTTQICCGRVVDVTLTCTKHYCRPGATPPQQDNLPCHTTNTSQEWLNEHDKVSRQRL